MAFISGTVSRLAFTEAQFQLTYRSFLAFEHKKYSMNEIKLQLIVSFLFDSTCVFVLVFLRYRTVAAYPLPQTNEFEDEAKSGGNKSKLVIAKFLGIYILHVLNLP